MIARQYLGNAAFPSRRESLRHQSKGVGLLAVPVASWDRSREVRVAARFLPVFLRTGRLYEFQPSVPSCYNLPVVITGKLSAGGEA